MSRSRLLAAHLSLLGGRRGGQGPPVPYRRRGAGVGVKCGAPAGPTMDSLTPGPTGQSQRSVPRGPGEADLDGHCMMGPGCSATSLRWGHSHTVPAYGAEKSARFLEVFPYSQGPGTCPALRGGRPGGSSQHRSRGQGGGVCMCAYMSVHVYVCVCVYTCACVCTWVHGCMCVCTPSRKAKLVNTSWTPPNPAPGDAGYTAS